MGMYDEMITDLENMVIVLSKHLRRCTRLLAQTTDVAEEEKLLEQVEKRITSDSWDEIEK